MLCNSLLLLRTNPKRLFIVSFRAKDILLVYRVMILNFLLHCCRSWLGSTLHNWFAYRRKKVNDRHIFFLRVKFIDIESFLYKIVLLLLHLLCFALFLLFFQVFQR